MHYKNGREAKNGDEVLMISGNQVIAGILYGAVSGNDHCNGYLAQKRIGSDHYANLSECLHIDDVKAAIVLQATEAAKVPIQADTITMKSK
jgi:hypothetical protein